MLNPDGTCNIRVVSPTNAYTMDGTYTIIEPAQQEEETAVQVEDAANG